MTAQPRPALGRAEIALTDALVVQCGNGSLLLAPEASAFIFALMQDSLDRAALANGAAPTLPPGYAAVHLALRTSAFHYRGGGDDRLTAVVSVATPRKDAADVTEADARSAGDREWMDVDEAALRWQRTPHRVRQAIRAGELPSKRIDGRLHLPRAFVTTYPHLRDAVAAHTQTQAEEAA